MGFIDKMLPLPRFRAVLFSRGMQEITFRAGLELMLNPEAATIEDAAELLPGMLDTISVQYATDVGLDDYTSVGLLEVMLAGWSEDAARMRIWIFRSYEHYVGQDDRAVHHGILLFPRFEAKYAPDAYSLSGDKLLVEMIHGAGRSFIGRGDPARVGGEIVAVEITPGGMSSRTLHRFPDFEQVRHAASATVARIKRGDLTVSVADGLVPVAEMVDPATGRGIGGRPANDSRATMPTPPMSRQERRHAERQARKAAGGEAR